MDLITLRRALVTIVLGALIVSAPAVARAELEITKGAVEAAWAEVVPKVEKATGVSFEGRIRLQVVEPDVVEEVLRRELLPQMRLQADDEEGATALANQQAALFASVLLGKYAFGEKVVFVCPATFRKRRSACSA